MAISLITPRPDPTDEVLVARLRDGDEAAFTAIVQRYERPLNAYARRLVAGSSIDPEDIVQEALARAYRALLRDRRPMALRAWLHCIVRNCALDEQRRRVAVPAILELRSTRSPADDAEARETFAELLHELAGLPARQRQALLLCVLEDRPYAWIAAELGVSVSAVKALISRARQTLRTLCLEGETPLADAA